MLKTDQGTREMFSQLGKHWDLSDKLFADLEKFTCKLYSSNSSCVGVNELRYKIFCAKDGGVESHMLPPCRDSLLTHARRANYQAGLWRRCLRQDPEEPDPQQHGWEVVGEPGKRHLDIDWMDLKPAPDAVLELLSCSCPKQCRTPSCVCIEHGLKCTDMCVVKHCDNFTCDDEED